MLNQVALMGRLTADPELRRTPSNISVTTFSLAVNRSYVKQGAERQTDFIDIVAWRNTADFICRYFKKGQMMAVSGSIQMRTYTDKEGKNRKAFEVLADNVYFTESKNPNATSSGSYEQRADLPAAEEPNFSAGDNDDFAVIDNDEDLPF
ncbi:MAG: single-stranded DNA-binding protein [Ruminococcaceae bacterium]|nr:single-stranded DNA-binding protein [Oscillospiraceae bacterium]